MQSFICSFGHSQALGSSDEQHRQYLLSEEDSFTVQTNDEHITDVMGSIHGDILDALVTGTHEGICFFWVTALKPYSTNQKNMNWKAYLCVHTHTHTGHAHSVILHFRFPLS